MSIRKKSRYLGKIRKTATLLTKDRQSANLEWAGPRWTCAVRRQTETGVVRESETQTLTTHRHTTRARARRTHVRRVRRLADDPGTLVRGAFPYTQSTKIYEERQIKAKK